jgi:hypothetical protein
MQGLRRHPIINPSSARSIDATEPVIMDDSALQKLIGPVAKTP